ncbi:MAG: FixH family protein [Candidatus Eremiobacteraeota bacterium]|nr:FixH family protein [Candidatus Eremiobacteraeota bacterium]
MKRLGVLLTIAVLAGCSTKDTQSTSHATSSADGLAVSVAFSPDPPKQGPETITVSIKDAQGGTIKGATVHIRTTMPQMAMSGPTLSAQDNGDGTYSAQTNLNYTTKWVFDISASAQGKTVKSQITEDIR